MKVTGGARKAPPPRTDVAADRAPDAAVAAPDVEADPTLQAAQINAFATMEAVRLHVESSRRLARLAHRAALWTAALGLAGSLATGAAQLAGSGDDAPPGDAPATVQQVTPDDPRDTAEAIEMFRALEESGDITRSQADSLVADAVDDEVAD